MLHSLLSNLLRWQHPHKPSTAALHSKALPLPLSNQLHLLPPRPNRTGPGSSLATGMMPYVLYNLVCHHAKHAVKHDEMSILWQLVCKRACVQGKGHVLVCCDAYLQQLPSSPAQARTCVADYRGCVNNSWTCKSWLKPHCNVSYLHDLCHAMLGF